MSDPRMIPAGEAKQLREGITPGRWRLNEWESVVGLTIEYWNESTTEVANVKLAEAAPDLAHTVVEQAAQIEQLDTALGAVAPQSLAQGRKLRRQAAQIERVREVLAWAEQAENRAHADWIATADTHHRDTALAYTQTATWLRYALGGTDD